jgi:hypothetical protein
MEKVIGILGEVFTENNKGFSGVLVYWKNKKYTQKIKFGLW